MEGDPPVPPPQPIGIYGWRKRCLYSFIVLLMVVVIINLALTVWILRVLDFSIDGMGKLKIIPKEGIRLDGDAEFLRPLYVEQVKATDDQVMRIESAKGVKMQAREGKNTGGSLLLGDNKLQAACDVFEVWDKSGKMRLSVTEKDITVGTDDMKYLGRAVFEGSVQTPTIVSPEDKSLTLSSVNNNVEIIGGQGVSVMSSNGDVELSSDSNILIQSNQGTINLDASDIFMKNIAVSEAKGGGTSYADVYQLCLCDNGRLFLSAAKGDCEGTQDICGNS